MLATNDRQRVAAMLDAIKAAKAAAQTNVEIPLHDFVRQCLIFDKERAELIPFKLWPAQEEALDVIAVHDKLVVPKGRQVGITWLEEAAMLHAATQHSHSLFPIARQSLEYAQDGIQRLCILAGYDPNSSPPNMAVLPESTMLPEWRPKIIAKTAMSLTLDNGSHFRALTATQQIARGLSAYWGLADELAFWPWPAEQIAAMESGCRRLHIVSTGNGEADYFHALWEQAVAGLGDYHPLFVPSTADPRRDADWYRRRVDEAADPELARREHARKPEDAFRSPEGAYFRRFDRERHVQPLQVVHNWRTWRAIDFGYRHPACLWLQRSPAGQLMVIDEYLPTDCTTDEFAAGIIEREAAYGLALRPEASYCDPAGKAANVQTAESEFEKLQQAGLVPIGRPSSIRDGCVRMMDALADPEQPLLVAERCLGLIRALSQVKPHKTRPECYDFDHQLFSHPLDALRYGVLWLSAPPAADYEPPEPTIGPSSGLWGRQW